jgi:hypothetical protein
MNIRIIPPPNKQTKKPNRKTKTMQRITKKQLQSRIETINSILNRPLTPYTQADGKLIANIGNFSLSQAYGGYCVHLMVNDGGGVSTPIWNGHITAREAYDRISAFISGLQFQK